MRPVTTLPPTTPGHGEARFEREWPLADVIPLRLGTTAITDEPASIGSTAEGKETDRIFNWASDGKAKKDLEPTEPRGPREPAARRTFSPGTLEHATLQAMKKHGIGAAHAVRMAAGRVARSKDK